MEGAAETQKNEEKMKISQPGEGGGEDFGGKKLKFGIFGGKICDFFGGKNPQIPHFWEKIPQIPRFFGKNPTFL